MAAPLAKSVIGAERIAALEIPKGGAWATAARAQGFERLQAMGLPQEIDRLGVVSGNRNIVRNPLDGLGIDPDRAGVSFFVELRLDASVHF